MAIHRVTARWSGFPGAPGYSNFYFMAGGGFINDAQSSVDRVADAFGLLALILPSGLSIEIAPEVEELDEATGIVSDFVNIDPPPALSPLGEPAFSGPTGGVVNWRTNDLRFGRRIRGRTFIVPLSNSAYEDDGTLTTTARNALLAFGDALVGGDVDSELVVWSRPVGGSGGVAATVVSASVPDMAAVLRSRRD